MKAITFHQPWASLVALGVKTIETRSWSTKYRGPLAIHAGMKGVAGAIGEFDVEKDNPRGYDPAYLMRGPIAWPYRLPLGAVVATCELVDVAPTEDIVTVKQLPYGDFGAGRFAWILDDIKHLKNPLPVKGKQGLWEWSA